MADTTKENVLLYDESENQFYPRTNAVSVMTTNTNSDGTYLNLLEFNNSIDTKVTNVADKLDKDVPLCTINGTSIKYGVDNTLSVGTNTGGGDGSSGVTLGSGLSSLNSGLPATPNTGYLYYNGSTYTWNSISTGNTGSTTLSTLTISDKNNHSLSYQGDAKKYLLFGDGILGSLTKTNNTDDTLKISTVSGSFNGIQYYANSKTPTLSTWALGADGYYIIRPGDGITLTDNGSGALTINTTGSTSSTTGGTTGTLSNKLTIGDSSSNITFDGGTASTITFGTGFNVSKSGDTLTITTSSTGSSTGSTTTDLNGYLQKSELLSELSNKLTNAKIWGQNFNTFLTGSTHTINGNIYMEGVDSKNSIDISIYMDGNSSASTEGTLVFKRHDNELIIGRGLYKTDGSNTCISTQTTSIKTYKSGDETYDYTFNADKFDIGTNNIRLGTSSDDEALIYWDANNQCVRINGSLCANGGITAFGVNSAKTSTSNFDFGVISASEIRLGGDLVAGAQALYDSTNKQLILRRDNNDGTPISMLLLSTSDSAGCSIYTSAAVDSSTGSDTKNDLRIYAGQYGTLYLQGTSQPAISITDTGVTTLYVGLDGSNLKIHVDDNNIYTFNVDKAKELGILTK